MVPKIDRGLRNLSWKLVCSKKNRFLVSTLFHSLSLSRFEWEWWLAFGFPLNNRRSMWYARKRNCVWINTTTPLFVFLHIKKARTHITLFETTFEFSPFNYWLHYLFHSITFQFHWSRASFLLFSFFFFFFVSLKIDRLLKKIKWKRGFLFLYSPSCLFVIFQFPRNQSVIPDFIWRE